MKRRFRRLAILTALLAVPAISAIAQETSASKDGIPDQAHLSAAKQLYDAADEDTGLRVYVNITVEAYAKSVAALGHKPTPEVIAQIRKIVAPDFDALRLQAKQSSIMAFARNLSLEEMMQLAELVQTPVMMRYKEARVAILTEIYSDRAPMLVSLRQDVWKRHQQQFQQLGLTFSRSKQ